MVGGSRLLATAAVLALAGCGGSDAKLAIRSIPAPLSATPRPIPYRIAEAHGHLALGNVALAIESFRKALREQPDSVDAMVGLAASYDQMARFDLSRRYYESALAIVPADTRVLTAFARSLDVQGESVEAAALRSEIRVRSAAAAPRPTPVILAPAPQKLARALPPVVGPSVTVKLPPARPAAILAVKRPVPKASASPPQAKPEPKTAVAVLPVPPAPVAIAPTPVEPKAVAPVPVTPIVVARKTERIEAPAPVVMAVKLVEVKPLAPPPPLVLAAKPAEPKAIASPPPAAPIAAPSKPVEVKVAAAPPPAAPVVVASKPVVAASKPVVVASKPVAIASKVEPRAAPAPARAAALVQALKAIELAAAPPPAPVIVQHAEAMLAALPPVPEPVEIAQKSSPPVVPETRTGQRLERLSLGEVALITTRELKWRPMVVARTAQSTTVRFVPLRKAGGAAVRIRLLNAARHEGLAARTRRLLAQRGWRQLAIGNANRVRQSSLVLYPANQRVLAKRLAAQFGIAIAKHASGTDVVVLLGRDATRRNRVRVS